MKLALMPVASMSRVLQTANDAAPDTHRVAIVVLPRGPSEHVKIPQCAVPGDIDASHFALAFLGLAGTLAKERQMACAPLIQLAFDQWVMEVSDVD